MIRSRRRQTTDETMSLGLKQVRAAQKDSTETVNSHDELPTPVLDNSRRVVRFSKFTAAPGHCPAPFNSNLATRRANNLPSGESRTKSRRDDDFQRNFNRSNSWRRVYTSSADLPFQFYDCFRISRNERRN